MRGLETNTPRRVWAPHGPGPQRARPGDERTDHRVGLGVTGRGRHGERCSREAGRSGEVRAGPPHTRVDSGKRTEEGPGSTRKTRSVTARKRNPERKTMSREQPGACGAAAGPSCHVRSVRPSVGPGEEVPGSAPLPDTRPLSCFTGVPQEEREDRNGSPEGRAAEMLKPRKSRPRTRFYSSFNQPGTSAFEPSRPASTPGRVRPADNPVMAT